MKTRGSNPLPTSPYIVYGKNNLVGGGRAVRKE